MQPSPCFHKTFILAAPQSWTTTTTSTVDPAFFFFFFFFLLKKHGYYNHHCVSTMFLSSLFGAWKATLPSLRHRMKIGGWGEENSPANLREMATTSKMPGRTGDLFHGVWGVYERQKWPPCESLPKLPRGETLEKYDFSHSLLRGGWRENREAKKEDEKPRGCIKKMMDGWLSRVGLIISLHSWVLKVCLGQKYSQDAELKIAFGLIVQLCFTQ